MYSPMFGHDPACGPAAPTVSGLPAVPTLLSGVPGYRPIALSASDYAAQLPRIKTSADALHVRQTAYDIIRDSQNRAQSVPEYGSDKSGRFGKHQGYKTRESHRCLGKGGKIALTRRPTRP